MEHAPSFVEDLAIVLLVAGATSVIFRLLRQPPMLGYLVAGAVVGPHTPLPVFADAERTQSLSELGVILVMFSIGLEFSLRKLMKVLPTSGLSALIQTSTAVWAGFALGRALGWTATEGVFLGAGLAISSTMVVSSVFREIQVEPAVRRFSLGVLVVQDLVAVVLIAVLTAVASGAGISPDEVASVTGRLALVLIAMVVVGLLVVPRAVRGLVALRSTEMTIVAAIGLCFGLALLARELGYSVALGAFLAGMLVAESGHAHGIEKRVQPLRDVFAAVFFVSVGMMVDPALVLDNLPLALGLSALVLVVQPVTIGIAGTLSGNGMGRSVRAGLSLGQIGEFSFIMIGIGTAAGVVRPSLLPTLVTVAAVTAFTTPAMVRLSGRVVVALDRALPQRFHDLLAIYESWFEDLRTGPRLPSSRVRRYVLYLGLDAAVVTTLVIVASVFREEAQALLMGWGLAPRMAGLLLVTAIAVVAMPFFLGVMRASQKLGVLLAQQVVPPADPDRPDLGDASRRMLAVAVQLAAVMAVGFPMLVLTQPFLPPFFGVGALLLLLLWLGARSWRESVNLHGHVRAGAQVVLELLSKPAAAEHDFEDIEELLPGLGHITGVELTPSCAATGLTLAELDLRARTGATIVAIRRGKQGLVLPGSRERLQPGDIVALTGTTDAIGRAADLLRDPGTLTDESASSDADPDPQTTSRSAPGLVTSPAADDDEQA